MENPVVASDGSRTGNGTCFFCVAGKMPKRMQGYHKRRPKPMIQGYLERMNAEKFSYHNIV
ncbi:MAG: hypothetical protein NC314_05310 [Roseburia sp.]|nr:hypothetical protein [Ruminococcus sp.]MCM1156401.1 hypothetical protein [Roseburia sp.]MCM1242239.1 hypothetical protein [Roseburia sp.]